MNDKDVMYEMIGYGMDWLTQETGLVIAKKMINSDGLILDTMGFLTYVHRPEN